MTSGGRVLLKLGFGESHSVWMGTLLGGCLEGGWVGSSDLALRNK